MSRWQDTDPAEQLERWHKIPRWLRTVARGIAVLAMPFMLLWAVVSRFCREFWSACNYTRLEFLIEIESFRRFWRDTAPRNQ